MSASNEAREDTLFDKATANYNAAKAIREISDKDELYLNIAGYHLQQATEMAIKHVLETEGVEYPWTHDIDQLIRIGMDNEVDTLTDGYIDEHSEMLSQWESKTRYIKGYLIEERKIDAAFPEVMRFLERVKERNHELDGQLCEHSKPSDNE